MIELWNFSKRQQEIEAEAVVVPNSLSSGTRMVHRGRGGMFAKKPKPPSAERVRQAVASKLTTPDESGVSPYEKTIDAMLDLAQNPTEKTASASVKAAEFLSKSAGFSDRPEEKVPFVNIILTAPDLVCQGELVPPEARPKLIPSFIDAELVSQNPAPVPEPTRE
jgi:hypothetical protein